MIRALRALEPPEEWYDVVTPSGPQACEIGTHLLAEHFRRIDPRYDRQLDVEVVFEGKTQTSRTQNLSLGGLYFESAFPMPIGATVQLRFYLPTQPEPVEVAGDVRWVVKKGPDISGVGVRFQGLRARDVWALNRFFQTSTS